MTSKSDCEKVRGRDICFEFYKCSIVAITDNTGQPQHKIGFPTPWALSRQMTTITRYLHTQIHKRVSAGCRMHVTYIYYTYTYTWAEDADKNS